MRRKSNLKKIKTTDLHLGRMEGEDPPKEKVKKKTKDVVHTTRNQNGLLSLA